MIMMSDNFLTLLDVIFNNSLMLFDVNFEIERTYVNDAGLNICIAGINYK